MKVIVICLSWLMFFGGGAVLYSQYSSRMTAREEIRPMAIALRDMGQAWLQEAQMDKRIQIKVVDIKKTPGSIAEIKFELYSREKFDQHYRKRLLQYLNARGNKETGRQVSFAF